MKDIQEHLEQQRYGRNKSTLINHAYIGSGEYRNKFDNISDEAQMKALDIVMKNYDIKYREV